MFGLYKLYRPAEVWASLKMVSLVLFSEQDFRQCLDSRIWVWPPPAGEESVSARQVPSQATAPGRAAFEGFFNRRNRHKIIRIKRISSLLKMAMLIYGDTLVGGPFVAVESSSLQVHFAPLRQPPPESFRIRPEDLIAVSLRERRPWY
jgi:hypothetical protein